jgi:hypothetical protein
MSDTDLHDLLVEIAEQAAPTDLLERVETGLRRRHRRRVTLASATTALVIGGGLAIGHALTAEDTAGQTVTTTTTATPTATPSAVGSARREATTSVTPAYLPPGATLGGRRHLHFPQAIVGGAVTGKTTLYAWYRLSGEANANTIPKGGVTGRDDLLRSVHPSTEIDVTFDPSVHNPQVPTNHASDYLNHTITIAGNRALVSIPTSGYGAYRIDWTDPDGYHNVMCDRLDTPQGRSGVPIRILIRIARSLYDSPPD